MLVGMSLFSQGSDQITGTSSYVHGLLRGLATKTNQVHVHAICNTHAFAAFNECANPRIAVARAAGLRVGRRRVARAAGLATVAVRSRHFARQFPREVTVMHYPLTLALPRTRLPTVVTLHDIQHHDLPHHFSRLEHLWRRIVYDAPARASTMIVTVSEYSRRRIIDTLDVAPDRVVAIPHGVDQERFSPMKAPNDEEVLWRLRLPERFLFYPAALWPHKNHLTLLDAFAQLADKNVHLLFCGPGSGRLTLIADAAAARGISDRVRHLGLLPAAALPAVYRRATALVFPSTYEGFGLPPLEAMASGCPVASSRAASLAEVCGDAAARLDPEDPNQMAEALGKLLADEQLRKVARVAGLEQAAKFSWSAVADAHELVYHRARALQNELGAGR